jgi:hypothetical protein
MPKHERTHDGSVELSATSARQASTEGVVRYVLAISLTLVIIALAVAYTAT